MDLSHPTLLSRMGTRGQEVHCFATGAKRSPSAFVGVAAALVRCHFAHSAPVSGSCVIRSLPLPPGGASGEWLPHFQALKWQSHWRRPGCKVSGLTGASSTAGALVRSHQSQ